MICFLSFDRTENDQEYPTGPCTRSNLPFSLQGPSSVAQKDVFDPLLPRFLLLLVILPLLYLNLNPLLDSHLPLVEPACQRRSSSRA